MAIVTVNLSQDVIKIDNDLRNTSGTGTFSELVDLFFRAGYNYSAGHPYYSSTSSSGTTLRLNFSDGAYTNFFGVVVADPTANSGSATATSVDAYWPSHYRLTYSGNLNYDYQGTSFHSTTETINAAAIQTVVPTYSPSYNSTVGNILISMQGSITDSSNTDFSGVITSLTEKADKFIDSATIGGTFKIGGNGQAIGLNLSTTALTGTLGSYEERYRDGSYISASATTIPVASSTVVDETLFANPTNFPGDDTFSISLPSTVYRLWVIASGAGYDSITLQGGGGSLSANAGPGNDTIILKGDSHSVDGGTGIDAVVMSGSNSNYTVTATSTGVTVKDKGGSDGTATLTNVERLQFSNAKVALDISGKVDAGVDLTGLANAGQVYRLYQAAFDRQPDKSGLAFWIGKADMSVPLVTIASRFTDSAEFAAKYGSPTDHAFIDLLYQHVLHRSGESGGQTYWYEQIDNHRQTREQILANFAESPENQAAVIGVIQNGIDYTT